MADLLRWARLLAEAGTAPRIAELCVEMLDIGGAGISMVSDTGVRAVVCATDDASARIEELQLTLGEGPCVDAVARGGPVLIPDLADRTNLTTERWPAFLDAATDAGVRAVFAFPLRIGAIRIGAMDLYRARAGALSDDELSAVLLGAEAAGVALLGLRAGVDGVDGVDGVIDGTDAGGGYDAQVHQATGMVMVQLQVPVEQAFVRLRARAFATGRSLHDVAADVVAGRIRFTAEDR